MNVFRPNARRRVRVGAGKKNKIICEGKVRREYAVMNHESQITEFPVATGRPGRGRLAFVIAMSALIFSGCETPNDANGRYSLPRTGTQFDDSAGPNGGKIRVALLVPLSGPHARIGKQLRDAAALALFQHGNDTLQLLPKDTKGTPEGAVEAARLAIADGARLVLGPLFAHSVKAVTPILSEVNINAIAFSNNRAVAGGPIFLIGSPPEAQVMALSAHLDQTNRRRVALIGPDTEYLRIIRDRLVQADKIGEIELVEIRLYRNGDDYTAISKHVAALTKYEQRTQALVDFTTPVKQAYEKFKNPKKALRAAINSLTQLAKRAVVQKTAMAQDNPAAQEWTPTNADYSTALSDLLAIYYQKLKTAETPHQAMADTLTEFELRETLGPIELDAIIVPVGGKPLLVLAPMFEYFNATMPEARVIGTGIWDAGTTERKRDLFGSQYVTPLSSEWPAFQKKFKDAYGYHPNGLVTTAYDAVSVAVAARNDDGPIPLEAAFLTREAGFDGVNGRFRFLRDGRNEKQLYIVELGPNGREYVSTWSPEDYSVPAGALGEDAERKMIPPTPEPGPTPANLPVS